MKLLSLLQLQSKKRAVGTLVLGKSNAFRELFFESESVYLCEDTYSGKLDLPSLVEHGVLDSVLTYSQLEPILLGDSLQTTTLPEILHRQGLLDDGDKLQKLSTAHVCEEIIDLLLRNTDSFTFQEGRVPEKLIASDGIASRTPLPLKQLISAYESRLETRRQIDGVLPSHEEVFVLTAEGMQYKQNHREDFPRQRLLSLVDGFRNLGTLLQATRFFEQFSLELIVDCLDRDLLKKTQLPEIRGIALETLPLVDCKRVLPWFKNAVRHSVDQLGARDKLATLHERLSEFDEAVVQYNFIGDALYRMGKSVAAIQAYQRARVLKPDETLISDKIKRIYVAAAKEQIAQGQTEEAAQLLEQAHGICREDWGIFRKLVELRTRAGKFRDIIELCERLAVHGDETGRPELTVEAYSIVLEKVPNHLGFKKRLINAYLDNGNHREATRLLRDLVGRYLERREPERALEMVEKAMRVGKNTEDLRQLRRKLQKKLGVVSTKRRNSRHKLVLPLVLLLAFLSYQAWSYLSWKDLEGENIALAEAERDHPHYERDLSRIDADGLAGLLAEETQESRYVQLGKQCRRFTRLFPLSLFTRKASSMATHCDESIARIFDRQASIKDALIAASEPARAEGDGQELASILEPLLGLAQDDPYLARAEELLAGMRELEGSAVEFLGEARRLESAKRPRAAFKAYMRLIETFPHSRLTEGLRLPILVESIPAGGEVFELEHGAKKRLGVTPLVLRITPDAKVPIEIQKAGHQPLQTTISQEDGVASSLILFREETWREELRKAPERAPDLAGQLCGLSYPDGVLELFDLRSHRSIGLYTRNSLNDLMCPAVFGKDSLYTVWNDGLLTRLPVESRTRSLQPLAQVSLPDQGLGLPSTDLVFVETGTLVFGNHRGEVHFLGHRRLGHKGSTRFDSGLYSLSRLGSDSVLAASERGTVAALSTARGKAIWTRRFGTPLSSAPRRAGDLVVVHTSEGELHLLDRQRGEPRFDPIELAAGQRLVFDDAGTMVFGWNPRLRELCAIDCIKGRVVEKQSFPVKVENIAAGASQLAIVHREGTGILVLDGQTLTPAWGVRVDSPIRWIGLVDDGGIVATLSDKHLVRFERVREKSSAPHAAD